MNDEADLTALYMAGLLSEEEARALEKRAKTDPELAAELHLLELVVGRPPSTKLGRIRNALSFLRTHQSATILTVVLFFLSVGTAIGAWYYWTSDILFEENFNSNYLNPNKWRLDVRRGIFIENGQALMQNRGYLVPATEFTVPIDVELDWTWLNKSGYPHYRDTLTVVLRTSGKHRPQRSWESEDGVRICYNATGGMISVAYAANDKIVDLIPPGAVEIAENKKHRIRVTDDGDTVSVYFYPEGDRQRCKEPLLTVKCNRPAEGHRIAIYNREGLADTEQWSLIDNVVVKRFQPKAK